MKTLVIVVPLTLLIWIYAERAQIASDSTQVLLKVSLADPGLDASLIDPAVSPASVSLDLSGPRVRIDQLKTDLEHKSLDGSLKLNLPPATFGHEGEQYADVAQLLNTDPLLTDSGVTIVKTTPPRVRVSVARIGTASPAVVLPQNLAVALLNVSFDPPAVVVRGPQPIVDRDYPKDYSNVAINLENQAANLTGGGQRTIEVPLVPPTDARLTMTPLKVKMTFEVGTRDRDVNVRSVLVNVVKLLSLEGSQVVVTSGPAVNNVIIRGPASIVNKFDGDNPSLTLTALLRIKPEDVGKTDLHRAVDIVGLPPEVKLVGPAPEVDFDVKDGRSGDQSRWR